jgi:hypothetical protein
MYLSNVTYSKSLIDNQQYMNICHLAYPTMFLLHSCGSSIQEDIITFITYIIGYIWIGWKSKGLGLA